MKKKTIENPLSNALQRLGEQPPDDNKESRFELLAKQLWDSALGYTEKDEKTGKEIIHKPDKTIMRLIYERIEGRVSTKAEVKSETSIADKISDQVRSRLNVVAEDS